MNSRKKASKGRINFLLMRSKGEVLNLAVSPLLLAAAFLFALIFIVVSVSIINRYFALYLDYRDLSAAYEETAAELGRLQSLYTYQASVADDYNNLMQAMNRADPQHDPAEDAPAAPPETEDPPAPADNPPAEGTETAPATPAGAPENPGGETGSAEAPPAEVAPRAPATVEEWAALFPAVPAEAEQVLDVERLRFNGGRFSFSLLSKDPEGRVAQGGLLLAFAVESPDGRSALMTFPDFDPASAAPNFEDGPGYSIRASKIVNGRLNLPPGGVVKSVAVLAKSARSGNIVMKKIIPLADDSAAQ